MQHRIAVIGIVVEKSESVERLNALLHEYAGYVQGRMGIPCRHRSVSVISVVVDAPQDVISAMAGRIGALDGVSARAAYSSGVYDQIDAPA